MSHNPYRPSNAGWTDRGIEVGPLNDLRQRVQQVTESIFSAEARVGELQEANGKMRDLIADAIHQLDVMVSADSISKADLESLLVKMQNVSV
jgi:hypothetical protein